MFILLLAALNLDNMLCTSQTTVKIPFLLVIWYYMKKEHSCISLKIAFSQKDWIYKTQDTYDGSFRIVVSIIGMTPRWQFCCLVSHIACSQLHTQANYQSKGQVSRIQFNFFLTTCVFLWIQLNYLATYIQFLINQISISHQHIFNSSYN